MSVKDIGLTYDEQFDKKMKLAKLLLKKIHDRKETELALKWLVRVSNIKTRIVEVKENRNAFLSYMIKILHDALKSSERKPPIDRNLNNDLAFMSYSSENVNLRRDKEPDNVANANVIKFHSKWYMNHSTYMAVKPILGRGTLIYMAVSRKPGLQNWILQESYEHNDR